MAAKPKPKPIQDRFNAAKTRVEKLTARPSNEQLLALYGLYKQATEGDASGSRPGLFDLKGRAKFDAWSGRKGLKPEQAMQKYVELVDELEQELG